MANQKSTASPCSQNTILSRRLTSGMAHFPRNPAVWGDPQSLDPSISFDVAWDGDEGPENHFQGYSVLVRIGLMATLAMSPSLSTRLDCD